MGEKKNILKEFLGFAKEKKQLWLLPLLIILIALALFVAFGHARVNIPFIYSEF